MRALSDMELELIVGGYQYRGDEVNIHDNGGDEYDIAATGTMDNATIDSIDNAMSTMSEGDLNSFANATAASFGIPVGPFTITPIINPFAGPNSIRYGVRVKARC